jgi:hypothetical protein
MRELPEVLPNAILLHDKIVSSNSLFTSFSQYVAQDLSIHIRLNYSDARFWPEQVFLDGSLPDFAMPMSVLPTECTGI